MRMSICAMPSLPLFLQPRNYEGNKLMTFPNKIFVRLKRFFNKYKLYCLIALPIIIAAVAAAIVVSTDKDAPALSGTLIESTSAALPLDSSQVFSITAESGASDPGTDTAPPATDSAIPVTESAPGLITLNETQDSKILLSGTISYPIFNNPNSSPIISAVNDALAKVGNSFKDYALNTPLSLAKTEFVADGSSLPFTFDVSYTIKLNNSSVLSIVFFINQFTGDMHNYIWDYCVNYNMTNGASLSLSDLFNSDSSVYMQKIYNYIENQIAQNPDNYYPDTKLVETFDYSNKWYLSSDGLVCVFNPYQIAPYVSGIIQFTIPYSEFSGMMKIDPNMG